MVRMQRSCAAEGPDVMPQKSGQNATTDWTVYTSAPSQCCIYHQHHEFLPFERPMSLCPYLLIQNLRQGPLVDRVTWLPVVKRRDCLTYFSLCSMKKGPILTKLCTLRHILEKERDFRHQSVRKTPQMYDAVGKTFCSS